MLNSIKRYLVIKKVSLLAYTAANSSLTPLDVEMTLEQLLASGVLDRFQHKARQNNLVAVAQLKILNSNLAQIWTYARKEASRDVSNRLAWQSVMDLCSQIHKFQGQVHSGEFRRVIQ